MARAFEVNGHIVNRDVFGLLVTSASWVFCAYQNWGWELGFYVCSVPPLHCLSCERKTPLAERSQMGRIRSMSKWDCALWTSERWLVLPVASYPSIGGFMVLRDYGLQFRP